MNFVTALATDGEAKTSGCQESLGEKGHSETCVTAGYLRKGVDCPNQ